MDKQPTSFDTRYLRASQAAKYLGLSKSTIWRLTRESDDFPRPVRLTANTTVFDRVELDAWVEARRQQAQGGAA